MRIVLVHNYYDKDHLKEVVEKMKKLSAPQIHAVLDEAHNQWQALEGCHRLRAAEILGLTPIIIPVEYSDDSIYTVVTYDGGDEYTIAEIVDGCYNNYSIDFTENEEE